MTVEEGREWWIDGATEACDNCGGANKDPSAGTYCQACSKALLRSVAFGLMQAYIEIYACHVCGSKPSVYINPGNLEPECAGCLAWRRSSGLVPMPPYEVTALEATGYGHDEAPDEPTEAGPYRTPGYVTARDTAEHEVMPLIKPEAWPIAQRVFDAFVVAFAVCLGLAIGAMLAAFAQAVFGGLLATLVEVLK